jgi:hypothetical protein
MPIEKEILSDSIHFVFLHLSSFLTSIFFTAMPFSWSAARFFNTGESNLVGPQKMLSIPLSLWTGTFVLERKEKKDQELGVIPLLRGYLCLPEYFFEKAYADVFRMWVWNANLLPALYHELMFPPRKRTRITKRSELSY